MIPIHQDGQAFSNPAQVDNFYIETKDNNDKLVDKATFIIQTAARDLLDSFTFRPL